MSKSASGDRDLKKKLVILFDEYPFEPGEYSFVRSELKKLLECFDVHIISVSPSTEQKMPLDERITLHHCMREFGIKEKFKALIGFLCSSYGVGECMKILKSGQDVAGRFYDAVVYYAMAGQMRSYVKRNRLITGGELVYSYWFNADCLAFLMEKKRYPNLRVISRIHGYDLYDERNPHNRQPFREYMDKTVDWLFFVADAGMEYYLSHWGKREMVGKKYIAAPIGTADSGSAQKNWFRGRREPFHVVSCSHVIPLKRVPLIIEGLARIKDIRIRWTHFGTGSHYEETVKYAEKLLGDKENISYEMTGFVPVEEIMRFYGENCIDCFLTTSSTEGSPVSVQEAMSFGIPVIATAVGELPNMIDGSGILLPENPQAQDVSGALTRFYHMSDEETVKMHVNARVLWEQKYNADENAEKFVRMLKEIN